MSLSFCNNGVFTYGRIGGFPIHHQQCEVMGSAPTPGCKSLSSNLPPPLHLLTPISILLNYTTCCTKKEAHMNALVAHKPVHFCAFFSIGQQYRSHCSMLANSPKASAPPLRSMETCSEEYVRHSLQSLPKNNVAFSSLTCFGQHLEKKILPEKRSRWK
jgi:hypothetical protein